MPTAAGLAFSSARLTRMLEATMQEAVTTPAATALAASAPMDPTLVDSMLTVDLAPTGCAPRDARSAEIWPTSATQTARTVVVTPTDTRGGSGDPSPPRHHGQRGGLPPSASHGRSFCLWRFRRRPASRRSLPRFRRSWASLRTWPARVLEAALEAGPPRLPPGSTTCWRSKRRRAGTNCRGRRTFTWPSRGGSAPTLPAPVRPPTRRVRRPGRRSFATTPPSTTALALPCWRPCRSSVPATRTPRLASPTRSSSRCCAVVPTCQ
mmetsp:Transcript_82548/g.260655  ORF Transcript_82548/g.260655 Transcript_82548/m.260655 type:complete len:265 (-) Transcript_82548:520-1314(-)